MDSIYKIYENNIGIAFQWRKGATLTQVIFRDTGFHLSFQEIETFIDKVKISYEKNNCSDCKFGNNCRSMLLQTPINKVSIAVSMNELKQIEDLLKGVLFQLKLNNYLHTLCKN